MKNSLEIAQEATLLPIDEIGARLDLEPDEMELYGRYRARSRSRLWTASPTDRPASSSASPG